MDPPIPVLYHLFEYFLDLNSSRQYGMGFPQAITFHEIKAWCTMRLVRLQQYELSAIKQLDGLFLQTHAQAAKRATKVRKK